MFTIIFIYLHSTKCKQQRTSEVEIFIEAGLASMLGVITESLFLYDAFFNNLPKHLREMFMTLTGLFHFCCHCAFIAYFSN